MKTGSIMSMPMRMPQVSPMGRDRHGQRGVDARADRGEHAGHDGVGDDPDDEVRAQREHGEHRRVEERQSPEPAQDQAGVLGDELGADACADDQADELHRLDGCGDEAAGPLVEVEDLLVEQASERAEADERCREEGQRPPDATEALDVAAEPPRLAERGRSLLGHDRLFGGAHGPALVRATVRVDHLQAEDHHDHRRDRVDEERRTPTPRIREDAGEERTDERADRVRGAVEGVHLRAVLRRVVVGDQRVVRRVDHRLADARAGSHDHEEPHGERDAGAERERGPGDCADEREPNAWCTVGVVGDRHLQQQRDAADEADDRQRTLQVEVELVADVGQEDAERGAVELIDGVEAEQDEQRVHGTAAGDAFEPALDLRHDSLPTSAGASVPAAMGVGGGGSSTRLSAIMLGTRMWFRSATQRSQMSRTL
jgi:hypothetical protein